ncbi:uncharacterized protein BX663DRAFT_542391 [Cokeromyces recurvatus]|uniref:uncharacterized protein n=1 Tax=Cokeromyces recurvatus TaxID=90255 RepID=UPI00221EB98B|nr:uncharacterized protein BX663DRAFT_542391 [Cokeromyces recurvatus]KAI7904113.1 hypothetical protein BX663DRAFT_542391 [Cokeromyces recurvatus]
MSCTAIVAFERLPHHFHFPLVMTLDITTTTCLTIRKNATCIYQRSKCHSFYFYSFFVPKDKRYVQILFVLLSLVNSGIHWQLLIAFLLGPLKDKDSCNYCTCYYKRFYWLIQVFVLMKTYQRPTK